jgi:hypothetical protein
MIEKLNAFLAKLVGPNSAHVIDGLVAWELTAISTGAADPSARKYAEAHPLLDVALTFGPPLLTAAAAKFRKAAAAKSAPPAPPAK